MIAHHTPEPEALSSILSLAPRRKFVGLVLDGVRRERGNRGGDRSSPAGTGGRHRPTVAREDLGRAFRQPSLRNRAAHAADPVGIDTTTLSARRRVSRRHRPATWIWSKVTRPDPRPPNCAQDPSFDFSLARCADCSLLLTVLEQTDAQRRRPADTREELVAPHLDLIKGLRAWLPLDQIRAQSQDQDRQSAGARQQRSK